MNKPLIKYGWLLVLLLVFSNSYSNKIDRGHWRSLKDGLQYEKSDDDNSSTRNEDWWSDMERRFKEKQGHRTPKDNAYESLKERERKQSTPPKSLTDNFSLPPGVMILIYIVLGGVLLFIVYLLFFKSPIPVNKKIESEPEEVLPIHQTVDELTEALSKYLKDENYREAIRIYFIFIIKAMREKEWINWEKEKTNHAYLFEIRKRSQYDAFSEVIFYFEIIWFGHRDISREQYNQLEVKFSHLLKSIKSSHE